MSKPRFAPPQNYGPLFTPEQIAAVRKARQRRADREQAEHLKPGTLTGQRNIDRNGY